MKQEQPWEIPPSWSWSNIGEVTDYVQRGKSPKYIDRSDLPVINQKCVRWQGLESEYLKFVDPSQWPTWSEERFVTPGDVLWNSTGTGTIGRAAIFRPSPELNRAVVDSHVTILRTTLIKPQFLYFWIRSPRVQGEIDAMQTGSTNQVELGRAQVLSTDIPIPPLPEQHRIVAKIEALMARSRKAREALDQIPALLERCRKSVLEAATNGHLTQRWRTEHGIPFNWRQVRLDEIAEVQGGVTKDSKKQYERYEEIPYLRVANVQRGHLDLSEVKTIRIPGERLVDLLLREGDVLFNEGGDLDKLGRGWIWEGQIERCSFQNHVFRARLIEEGVQPKYISWWGNHRGIDYFMRSGKQTTNLASINKSMLCALPISLPTADEQIEIVKHVEVLLAATDVIEARSSEALKQLEHLESTILAKAFRGELVPQDPADETAEALLARIRAEREQAGAPSSKRGRGKAPVRPKRTR